jgi:hypothetical protein
MSLFFCFTQSLAKLHNFPELNKKDAEKVAEIKNNAYLCSVNERISLKG